MVIDDGAIRAIELLRKQALGDCHADTVGKSLA